MKNPAPGTKAEGITYTDCWALHLKNLENGKVPTWEKLSKKGEYPSQRSGTACTIWKNKMLVFGGVKDDENENHKVKSVFYDDLFALDMERRRWFKLNMKKKAGDRRRRKKKKNNGNDSQQGDAEEAPDHEDNDDDSDEEDVVDGEATSNGWDLDKLRSNMFAFIDANGNIVYEKIDDDDDNNHSEKKSDEKKAAKSLPEVAEDMETDGGYEADDGYTTDQHVQESSKISGIDQDMTEISTFNEVSTGTITVDNELEHLNDSLPRIPFKPGIGNSEVMKLTKEGVPEAVARKVPLPRINSQILVRGNTLFIYGGILEVGEREVTLDDCWAIDLQKREEWNCIWNGTMHRQVWKGAESDNESYISTDRGTGGIESDDDGEFDEFDEPVDNIDEEAKAAAKAARKEARKAAKKEKMKGIREEIKSLNEQLSLGDTNRTPLSGEDLASFYSRTALHWEMQASEIYMKTENSGNDEISVKELKREGFSLARDRFEEVKPVLERLDELQGNFEEKEEHKKEKKKSSKKDKKKKDKKK